MSIEQTPVMSAEEARSAGRLSLQGRRPPTVVPGYELEHSLGEGAYGEVWVAIDQNTNTRVAIKFYSHRGGLDWAMLSREVEKLRFLRADRYVVQLLEVGWNATPPYYVMEFMERGSLEVYLEKHRPTVAEALQLTRDVANGLIHAHTKGILHCDLKPANILLDQDGKPRLADFGQARLTHEQNPALGTLFYMAPEQADLKAAPDVRWDVYALGALLYRVLTGEPPFRDAVGVTELQQAPHLEERLTRYRLGIAKAPPPSAHLKVPGVDRRLAEIIDRCLAVNPEKRFPNVQAVVEALDNRALRRARRPLLVLGAFMPLLFLAVVALFALRGLQTTVADSDKALTRRALLSDRFAAQFAASAVARQVSQRWTILEEEGNDVDFHALIRAAAGKPHDSPEEKELLRWLDDQRQQHLLTTRARSWFLTDTQGTLLAVSPYDSARNSLGKNLAYRSFFHGEGRDYTPEEIKDHPVKPINRPVQSIPFVSTRDGKPRMVAFSVPVRRDPQSPTLGVLGMGVNLGEFEELLPEGEEDSDAAHGQRCAVLVETRADAEGQRGLLLQHPFLRPFHAQQKTPPRVLLPDDVTARVADLVEHPEHVREGLDLIEDYRDPVRAQDSAYEGRWLAAVAPVVIQPRRDGDTPEYTGWVVIVQERAADAVDPVRKLEAKLLSQGMETLLMLLLVMAALWASVVLLLSDAPRSRLAAFLRRRAGLKSGTPKTSVSQGGAATVQGASSGGGPSGRSAQGR
jgi:serine/threonine protein kinase